MKKKGFTIIELMIVVGVIAILAAVLVPKVGVATTSAKEVGAQKNQAFLEGMVRNGLERHFYDTATEEEALNLTYQDLNKNVEIANLVNPLDKTRRGIGFVDGEEFVDTNKAAYIFTRSINADTLPKGTSYVVVKQGKIVSNTPEEVEEVGVAMVKKALSEDHSLAIGNDGNLYAWGDNRYGQLGAGDTVDLETPTKINLPENAKPVSIEIDMHYSFAVADDGKLYAWGINDRGQLGTGNKIYRNIPTLVSLPEGVKAVSIATNRDHTLVLAEDGSVYAWGANQYGQLGIGNRTSNIAPELVKIPNNEKVVSITAGYYSSAAVTAEGRLYTWGDGTRGQLGTEYVDGINIPTLVNLPEGAKPISVQMGEFHTILKTEDGDVYGWGYNSYGQAGIGDVFETIEPTLLAFPDGVKVDSILAGPNYSLALGTDGNLYVWGYNMNNQLGLTGTQRIKTPALVELPNNAKPSIVNPVKVEKYNSSKIEITTTTGEIIVLEEKY